MNRDQKEVVVKEISSELDAANAVFAVDYRGISVPQAAELRNKLRETDASFNVVKNRLAKLATNGTDASDALDEHLVGPTALTFVQGDAVVAAKTIADFIKANRGPHLQGWADGRVGARARSVQRDRPPPRRRRPPRPARRPRREPAHRSGPRTLNQLIAGLAIQLSQVAEQGLVSGEAPAPAEEPEAEEAAPQRPRRPLPPRRSPLPKPMLRPTAETETSETDDEPDQTDETPEAAGDDAEADAGDEKENQ